MTDDELAELAFYAKQNRPWNWDRQKRNKVLLPKLLAELAEERRKTMTRQQIQWEPKHD